MCGIAGIFSYAGSAAPIEEASLLAIRDQMRSRGPDGAGLWLDPNGRIGLAHRRLSIIDLSNAGAQPMVDRSGRFIVTFNGEIYNYATLRGDLVAQGIVFKGHSDTEVVLELYAREGPAMLSRLRGMFSIAIFDREKRELFLARDPYGIKPLYLAEDRGCLRFASQVKAIISDRNLTRDLDPAGVVGFHLLGSIPEPFTLYRSVRALPPGTYVVVGEAGVSAPKQYASVPELIANADPRPFDPEQVRGAVRESIAQHMIGDVDVGVFLSSGVDSGALLGLMCDVSGQSPRAVTLRFAEFSGSRHDETLLASKVAAIYGAEHHIRTVTAQEFRDDLPHILDAMDQPTVDGFNTWFVSKAARELGLKVALSGLGGDELFAGYTSFQTVPTTYRRFRAISGLGLAPIARRGLGLVAPGFLARNPKVPGLLELPATWAGTYLLRRALMLPDELEAILEPAVVREGLERLDAVGLIARAITPMPKSDNGIVATLEASIYMRNQLLRDSDWAGMAHSLEVRTPLVDYSLLASIAPMMPTMKAGAGKSTLASAPAMPLPSEIVDRPKTGFQIPITAWLTGTQQHEPKRTDQRRWAVQVFRSFSGGVTGLAEIPSANVTSSENVPM